MYHSKGSDERPFIDVAISKTHVSALIDSGANHSILGKQGLHLISSLNLQIQPDHSLNVFTADGSPQVVLGRVSLPISIKRVTREINVLVVPSVQHPLILGIDFCKKFHLSIDFHKRQWQSGFSEIATVNRICPFSSLTPEQQASLERVKKHYSDLGSKGLGRTNLVKHIIDTGEALPIKQRYHRLSPAMQTHLNAELDKMLELAVVRPSKSPWSSPVLLVKKSSGKHRLCFDGRKLNSVTKKDAYPLPYVSAILDKLRDANFLTSIDLKSAFWQIPLEEGSCEKTAFTVPGRGLFEFVRMPFGLCNAAQSQQRLMDQIFRPELEPNVFVYLDDIIIVTSTFENHISILYEVLNRLKDAGLTVNADKCEFCRPSLSYLGFIVDQQGLRTNPDKVEAINSFPQPKNVTEMKRFIGMASWYRRFVPNFSAIAAPLVGLTKGKQKKNELTWTEEAKEAFKQLKSALISSPVLVSPDFSLPFTIQTDASNYGIGAVLTQTFDNEEHVIAYASRVLNQAERNYSVTERECLSVVFALEKFRCYVEGTEFTVVTDHASLLWLQRMQEPTGRLARWAVKLQQFNFKLVHRPGPLNVVPDALSRAPLEVATLDSFGDSTDPWYNKLRESITNAPQDYPGWLIKDNLIYKLVPSEHNLPINLSNWKLVVPTDKRKAILQKCHDDPLSAHLGIFKTYRRVSENYYWPKLKAYVVRYVTRCPTCLSQKVSQQTTPGLMGNQKIANVPWQIISMDIMGPFPRSSSGNTCVLVITDWFSKFTLTYALRQATANKICEIVERDVFLLFGVPETIMVDNGVQFRSTKFQSLLKKYEVPKLWYNAKYHAQVNFCERSNRVIKTALKSYISENQRHWDVELPRITQAIRTATHEITEYPPSFLMFGRHVPTSGRFYSSNDDTIPNVDRKSYASQLPELREIFKRVESRLARAHLRNAHHYNLRRRPLEFMPGDTVYKRNYTLSDATAYYSSKLAPKFIRCTISKKISRLVYELIDSEGKNLGRWHVKDLKAVPPDEPQNA